jgi:hypothetical protein
MSMLRLDRLLEFLTSIELTMAMLWLGLAIFTVGLAVLMYTRWGQYKPLRKCMAMSLLAHLLLAGYAATVQIITPIVLPTESIAHVSLGDGPDEKAPPGGSASILSRVKDQPWEVFPSDAAAQPKATDLERGKADRPAEPQRLAHDDGSKLSGGPALEHVALAEAKPLSPKTTAVAEAAKRSTPGESAAAIEAPPAQRRDAATPAVPGGAGPPARLANEASAKPARATSNDVPAALLAQILPLPKMTESDIPQPLAAIADPATSTRLAPVKHVVGKVGADGAYGTGDGVAASAPGAAAGGGRGPDLVASNTPKLRLPAAATSPTGNGQQPVPDAYRLRVAPNRDGVAQSHGGTSETEAAVKAALRWLADNQAADGRWDPRTNAAGNETNVLGRNRQGAGSRADTAMTGLALLAFLGSGHTHLEGPYRSDVGRGLEFLMQTQTPDGNLSGQAAAFEFMYCHAMATCAMSEAYGMTRDQRLQEPVRRAIGYTIAAQDPKGGGWRYKPGDAGDTSQLGWQLMSLKSAELAGIPMPERTRQGMIRYLQSVSSGGYGGRASYRPGEQPTRSMTAEALVCWQFLGLAREHPACDEAGDFVVGELPGQGVYNLYYWYYATLGMYQLQGVHWQRWNEALRAALVSRQIKEGSLKGSWDTSDLWGSHGGRVYTTAIATLTLEVYYRFLPLYAGASREKDRGK